MEHDTNINCSSSEITESIKQEEQKNIVKDDIIAIEEAIASNDKIELKMTHELIDGRYSIVIPNLGQSMCWYNAQRGFIYEMLDDKKDLIHNLRLMKLRLESYLYEFPRLTTPNNINVNVPVTNEINITISFTQAKQIIEDMPGLNDVDTEAIKAKIDELERIEKEPLPKKKKWEKIKPILAFAMDKGADVAITIMSLIIQKKLGL